MSRGFLALGLLFVSACAAQNYEFGGTIGYGFYRDGSIYSPSGKINAGIRDRFAAGAVIGEDLYEHMSGELRYLYHDGHPFIGNTDIQGQSHTFTYELLFHWKDRDHRLRPFFAAGAGAKLYEIVGPPPPPTAIASLNAHDEWKVVVSLGFGVKYRVQRHILVRADFRDYMTPFPKRQIAPAEGGTARGVFQQFTPMIGIGYSF